MKNFELSEDQWEFLSILRENGCAVTVFLPQELGGADAGNVEDEMYAAARNEIYTNGNARLVV